LTTTPTDPLVGSTIAHYTVVAKLGGGGMGVVYKAIDTKLGRTVALKFLPPQWSHDEGAKQRFMREAQAASATNHRNICVIHDIDHTDDGRLFIVMAYYEGQTLKQRLESGPPPIGEALEIATEVAEGLAKAHAQGVVHRDIKPGNLVVSDDGVKILDFGLAKFADALQLTIPGSTIGTSGYMSPEQARGEEADARSDVWALGVVMYEMLTGEVPFKGAYPEAIFYAIKTEPVPPLRKQGRDIPETLETIVMRALEKDPDKRYQTARELARDLRLLLGRTVPVDLMTGPLPPLPLVAPPKPLSRWQRARAAVTPGRAIAAAVAVVAAAVGSYVWLARPVVRIPVAIAPVANYTGEPELDGYRLALTETLLEELEDSPNIHVVPFRRLVEIVRQFITSGDASSREAIQAIATHSGAQFVIMPALVYQNQAWVVRAEIRDVESGIVTKTYETEGITSSLPKDAVYRLMASLADGIQADFKANGPGRSYSRQSASSRFRNLDAGRAFADGLNRYEQLEYASALEAFRRAVMEDDQHAIAHAWLSRVFLLLNKRNDAVAAAKRAKQLVTTDSPERDVVFVDAVLADSQSDSATAEQQYRRLATLQRDDASAQIELADFLKRQNRDQESIGAYRAALARDAGYIRPYVDLCQLYTRDDEYPLAEKEGKTALDRYRAVGNRGGEAQALLALSDMQRKQRNFAEAKTTSGAARDIFQSLGYPYGLARVHQYLGAVAADAGDFPGAVQLFKEALTRSREVGNRDLEGLELMNLATSYEALGQRAQALDYYQQSQHVYQQNGDDRRAAEQEAMVAWLLVEFGSNQNDALRRLNNARASFQTLGHIEGEVFTREAEAASSLRQGHHDEARQQLRAAISMAKERRLGRRVMSMTVRLAESYMDTGQYGEARVLLEEAANTGTGREDLEVAIALGKVHERLGDFDRASDQLQRALSSVEAVGLMALAPSTLTALGEIEYESGKPKEARAYFEKSASLWTDDLPDQASIAARCWIGLLDTVDRSVPKTRTSLLESIKKAADMGRLHVESQCRLAQSRIHFRRGLFADADALLREIPVDGDRKVGPELAAQALFWRGRALAEQGDPDGAKSEMARARKVLRDLIDSLPAQFQPGFSAKLEVRRILEEDSVQDRR
jgi:tetratricopeptide (TPR) repeat protein